MKSLIKDLKKDFKFNRNYIYFLIPLVIVAILFVIIIVNGITKTDTYILSKISTIVSYNLTVFMGIITSMCKPLSLVIITIFCLVAFRNKKIGIGVAMALLFSGVLNLILKFLFSRQRPLEYMLIDESGYSFPSGHSMVSIAFYGFLIYVTYKFVKNKYIKASLISFLSILIASIAFSRLYFGVHYPTDVLAGLTFGYVLLCGYIKVFNKYILSENGNKNENINGQNIEESINNKI